MDKIMQSHCLRQIRSALLTSLLGASSWSLAADTANERSQAKPELSVAGEHGREFALYKLETKIVPFTVSGKSYCEVNKLISQRLKDAIKDDKRARRMCNPDKGSHACTAWPIPAFRWPDAMVSRVNIFPTAVIYLPQLDPASAKQAPELASEWQRYIKELERHERQHAENAFRIGQEMLALIKQRKLPAKPSSEERKDFTAMVEKETQATIDRLDLDGKLDRKTDHGATEGARLKNVDGKPCK